MHYEGWAAQTGVIESSKPGEIIVGDRTQGWWFGSAYGGKYPQDAEEGRGMIVGHMHALDQPRRVALAGQTLYFIPPRRPRSGAADRSQETPTGLRPLAAGAHLIIQGLAVQAASARLDGASALHLRRLPLLATLPITFANTASAKSSTAAIRSSPGETGIFVGGHDNAFLNCSVRFSAGAGLHLRGYHHTIHNCLIDEVSYTGHYLNAITDAVADFAGL